MAVEEKLLMVVKLAQAYILLYLKEYLNSDEILDIENLFNTCPVIVANLDVEKNEFGKSTNVGGVTQKNKIVIDSSIIDKVNINNELELNKLLGTIIHEYAHKIRSIKNQYGEMLEESFATIFAEVCINNARLKLNDTQVKKEPFQMLTSIKYQNFESQIRALLYVLKSQNLDHRMISEYIAGNQERFIQTCIDVFGNDFALYFNSISSIENKNSEQLIINIITNYIRQHDLNISDYWLNNSELKLTNLYFKGSPTLSKAVVNAGIDSYSEDQQEYYKFYESSVKISNDNDAVINQEKLDRIRNYIETSFSIAGKSLEEIYDTIIDLCSAYIQHKNKEDEESKLFISEITRLIPDIDSLKTKFVNLRVAGLDKKIFEDLDLNNISYNDIILNMNKLLNIETTEINFKR